MKHPSEDTRVVSAAHKTAATYRSEFGFSQPAPAWLTAAYEIDSANQHWPDDSFDLYEREVKTALALLYEDFLK